MLSHFFFRRRAPGISTGLAPTPEYQVLGDGIPVVFGVVFRVVFGAWILGGRMVGSLPFFEARIEDKDAPVGLADVVENGKRLG